MNDGDNRIRCFRVQCLHFVSLYPFGACKQDKAHVGSERHHVIPVDNRDCRVEGLGGSMVESVEGEGSREVWRELIHGTFPRCACW